jgi:hypothetical protein
LLIRRAAPLLLLILLACTSTTSAIDRPIERSPGRPSFAPVYFYDGDGLIPEFIELEGTEVPTQLVAALAAGPERADLTSSIPVDTTVRGEFERHEILHLDLAGSFWSAEPSALRPRMAQVIFTMASLEEGRSVRLLLFGAPDSKLLRAFVSRPLARTEFRDLRPWIQVVRPVPGSLVSSEIPVEVELRGDEAANVEARDAATGSTIATATLDEGSGVLEIPDSAPARLVLRITYGDTTKHHADYEVTFIAP